MGFGLVTALPGFRKKTHAQSTTQPPKTNSEDSLKDSLSDQQGDNTDDPMLASSKPRKKGSKEKVGDFFGKMFRTDSWKKKAVDEKIKGISTKDWVLGEYRSFLVKQCQTEYSLENFDVAEALLLGSSPKSIYKLFLDDSDGAPTINVPGKVLTPLKMLAQKDMYSMMPSTEEWRMLKSVVVANLQDTISRVQFRDDFEAYVRGKI